MPIEALRKPLSIPAGLPILLRDLVHERAGIFFEADRCDMMLDKLAPLAEARNCNSFLDYYYLLKYETNQAEDWELLIEALSVQETYFWREMPQIRLLIDTLIPEWFTRTAMPLRIWSAACATGEEPYTITMALLEAGWGSHPIEIYASDASLSAIAKARAGVYREKAFRQLPFALRDKYFKETQGGWQITTEISKRVTFKCANLLSPPDFGLMARSQIVFCRNVFIYFSPHAIRQTLASFASRMPLKSYLFVGAAESLLKLTADYELREMSNTFVYVRI